MSQLDDIRKKIDQLDAQLVEILEQRLDCAKAVAQGKNSTGISLTDRKREEAVIKHVQEMAQSEELKDMLPNFYEELFAMNKQAQIKYKNIPVQPRSFGIIGYGNFGKLFADLLTAYWPGADVKVFSRHENKNSLEEVCTQDVVIPCVPISAFKETLEHIKPLLRKDTVLIDVCTVKVLPKQWMQEVLGEQPMIATHPMFGPESTNKGKELAGKIMMMENISAAETFYKEYKSFWEEVCIQVVEITCDEHDKYAAYSINYNHFIGRMGEYIGVKHTPIDTKGCKITFDSMYYVVNTTWQLFEDMQNYNPYAEEMMQKVIDAAEAIRTKVTKK